jgi:hypothetical protein
MPSIISATTTTGLVTTADNSGSLQLATNSGTTAVTIDTSQNVTFAKPIAVGGNTLGAGNASSFKNRIINGAMTISQYNGTSSNTPINNGYPIDRFIYKSTQASKFTAQQVTTAPAGFINSLQLTVASAVTVGSSDFFAIGQRIEGLNLYDIGFGTAACKTTSLSFQVRSSLTGTFGGALTNAAGDASYAFTYTISAANTWTSISIAVPAVTTGTWVTDNSACLQVWFGLGVGSTYNGTAGSWVNGNNFSATGATSVVATAGATFLVTGVQLEVGSTATSFDYRPYGTELALCQRYFYKVTNGGNDNPICMIAGYSTGTGVGVGYGVLSFPVIMRIAPDIYQVTGTNYFRFSGNGTNLTFDSFGYNERSITGITLTNNSSLSASATVGYAYWCRANNANAVLGFSAEL